RHITKAGSTNALMRGGGSIGITGAARCVLLAAKHPDDANQRCLAVVKSNLARPPFALSQEVSKKSRSQESFAAGIRVQCTDWKGLASSMILRFTGVHGHVDFLTS